MRGKRVFLLWLIAVALIVYSKTAVAQENSLTLAVKQAYLVEKGPTDKPLEVVIYKQKDVWVHGHVGEERSQFGISFLAELREGIWVVALGGSDEFYSMAQKAPDEVVSPALKEAWQKDKAGQLSAMSTNQTLVSIPFAAGTWIQVNGPHDQGGTGSSGTVWNSVDFIASGQTVRLAQDGTIRNVFCNGAKLVVEHDTGVIANYFHLGSPRYSASDVGRHLTRGTVLGYTSQNLGGCSGNTGGADHLHFGLETDSGSPRPIDGFNIGGYTIRNGSSAYSGSWSIYLNGQTETYSAYSNIYNYGFGKDCNDIVFGNSMLFNDAPCAVFNSGSKIMPAGRYGDLGFLNDAASSVYVPSGKSVLVSKDSGGAGQLMCVNRTMWDLSQDRWVDGSGMNDSISWYKSFDDPLCGAQTCISGASAGSMAVSEAGMTASSAECTPYPMPGGGSTSTNPPPDPNTGPGGGSGPSVRYVDLFGQANFGGLFYQAAVSGSEILYNVVSAPNFQHTYSFSVPDGISVRIYSQRDGGGEQQCWNQSVPNLNDHGFVHEIKSIRVYDHDVCGSGSGQDNSQSVIIYAQPDYNDEVWRGDSGGSTARGYGTIQYPSGKRATSIRIPDGWSVKIFSGYNFVQPAKCLKQSSYNIQSEGWDHDVNSVYVYNYNICDNGPQVDRVQLFYNTWYDGSPWWQSDPGIGGMREYNRLDNLQYSRSIALPANWSVRIYENENYGGESRCFYQSQGNLTDHGWTHEIKSIRVYGYVDCVVKPNAPKDQRVTALGSDALRVSWTINSDNHEGFHVFRFDPSTGNEEIITTLGRWDTSYTIYGLECNKNYFFWVEAYNSGGGSPKTPWVEGWTDSCPIVCSDHTHAGVSLYDGKACNPNQGDYLTLGEGVYNLPNFNDEASSVYVGSGYSARLYQHIDRQGESICAVGSMWDFGIDNYPDSMLVDNTISSLQVFANSSCTAAPDPVTDLSANLDMGGADPKDEKINLSWRHLSANHSFTRISRWNYETGVWEELGQVGSKGTTFTDYWPLCSQYNYYLVVTVNDLGESEPVVVSIRGPDCLSGCTAERVNFDGLVLFDEALCLGDRREFTAPGDYNLPDFANRATSIFVKEGWSVGMWDGPNQTGRSACWNVSPWNLAVDQYPDGTFIDNTIESIAIYVGDCPTPPPPPWGCMAGAVNFDGVVLFDEALCVGEHREFTAPGKYNLPDFVNRTSSIFVKEGWFIGMWDEPDQTGRSACWNGSPWNLALDQYSDGTTINDSIESIEIYTGNCPQWPQPEHHLYLPLIVK